MKHFRWVFALSASGAGIWFAAKGLHWDVVREALTSLRQPWWLLLVFVVSPLEFFLRTVRWKFLFNPLKNEKLATFFPITVAAFFINNVLPFRAGELARVYWTHEKTGVRASSCLAVLAVDRVFDMLCLLVLVSIVLLKKAFLFQSKGGVAFFGMITLSGLLFFLALARFPVFFQRIARAPRMPARLAGWIDQFIAGSGALRSARAFLAAFAVSLIFWSVNVTATQVYAHVFSIPLTWVDSAWLMVAFCFGALVPSAPGYVGTLEAAGVGALMLLGHDKNLTLPFILVAHFSQILNTILWGIPSLWLAGLKVERAPRTGAV